MEREGRKRNKGGGAGSAGPRGRSRAAAAAHQLYLSLHHTDTAQRRPPPSRDAGGGGAGPASLPRDAAREGDAARGVTWGRAIGSVSFSPGVALPRHVTGARGGFGGRHVVRPRGGPGMAGAGSNWLSGVNVVLVMAYGSLVSDRERDERAGGDVWGPGGDGRGVGPGRCAGGAAGPGRGWLQGSRWARCPRGAPLGFGVLVVPGWAVRGAASAPVRL